MLTLLRIQNNAFVYLFVSLFVCPAECKQYDPQRILINLLQWSYLTLGQSDHQLQGETKKKKHYTTRDTASRCGN